MDDMVTLQENMRNPAKGRLVHGVGKDGSTHSGEVEQ